MPKRKFIDKEFNANQMKLINFSNRIMNHYAAQGYDLSLRQLYYQLVAQNVIQNVPRSYKMLGELISLGRRAGLVDWDHIVDRGRPLHKNTLWSGPGAALKAMSKSFQFNRWKRQPYFMEVMVEKQALEGVLLPVCSKLGIGFTANKGYSSDSALYEAAIRYQRAMARGKKVCVLYLGDHDPSGCDMTRDIRERLMLFCETDVEVVRLALNMRQVERYNLPPNPAKLSDSRSGEYVERHGDSSWELDAIPPHVLADFVIGAVGSRLDKKAWEEDTKKEEEMRARLVKIADELERENLPPTEETVIPDDDDPARS